MTAGPRRVLLQHTLARVKPGDDVGDSVNVTGHAARSTDVRVSGAPQGSCGEEAGETPAGHYIGLTPTC